ncbi:uncharacterized protein LOC122005736 isoform X3 [Zingiber officinale]|uniref:uncharacterized protein LOC122005736 isoform X3 n=1 Tax=Zingiber officinale TaxID=94328 RepID=UPI001C4B15D6|nr:uncharacterized protein LOC122005736 isoform X3 [Zingiber officinale]
MFLLWLNPNPLFLSTIAFGSSSRASEPRLDGAMGWSHPDVSLDDLLLLVKGFVDILILTNGYQSSGLPAVWDAATIKNAVHWGLFFQDVFKRISGSKHYEESLNELDKALRDIISNPSFPQGLVYLSSSSLCNASDLVIEYLLQVDNLGAKHLISLLTAIVEMDVNDLTGLCNVNPSAYADRLILQMESLKLFSKDKGNIVNSGASSTASDPNICHVAKARNCNLSLSEAKECNFADPSCFLIHEILKRQTLISCTSSVENCLNSFLMLVLKECLVSHRKISLEGRSSATNSPENMPEFFHWSQWRMRCLLYLTDKRTIKILSGAKLIFSAPKVQWIKVLDQLKFSSDVEDGHLLEIVEISLLGFISCKWIDLIKKFVSHSCDYLPISEQYSLLHRVVEENSKSTHPHIESLSSMEKDIIEYVAALVDSQHHKLWQLPHVLVAAVPLWSILFRAIWNDIEKRFVGEASSHIRCNDCNQEGKEHIDCCIAIQVCGCSSTLCNL